MKAWHVCSAYHEQQLLLWLRCSLPVLCTHQVATSGGGAEAAEGDGDLVIVQPEEALAAAWREWLGKDGIRGSFILRLPKP